ncbi:MAG: FtsH protease activity modulator HflK [Verrucomicrobia bacterium]|nr:FtsH protease activity modulator HflK [Verrucomicrobiota bacterium]
MVIRVGNTYYTLRVGVIGAAVAAFLVLIALGTMIFTVKAEYQGIILRFGKYSRTVDPGLQFKLPFGIDRVYQVPVKRQLKQEFGFGTDGSTNPFQSARDNEQELERNMVTGDLNAATVEWIIQYRIDEPVAYLFNFRDPDKALRDVSEAVMREVVGDRTVDEVITIGRQEIEAEALVRLKQMVTDYNLGVGIDQLQLKNVNPPPPVQPSFNEVNQAQQEREKMINQANGEYNRFVPHARGQAQERISNAEGYAIRRINEAEGDAARFNALLAEYVKAPEVTRERLYLEAMAQIMPALTRKIVIDEEASRLLPLLQLNPEEAR